MIDKDCQVGRWIDKDRNKRYLDIETDKQIDRNTRDEDWETEIYRSIDI